MVHLNTQPKGKATDRMEAFDGTGLGYLCCLDVRQVLCCPHVRQVAHPICLRSPADQTVSGANRVDCISGVEEFAQVRHVFEIPSLLLQHCTAPGSIQSFSSTLLMQLRNFLAFERKKYILHHLHLMRI